MCDVGGGAAWQRGGRIPELVRTRVFCPTRKMQLIKVKFYEELEESESH